LRNHQLRQTNIVSDGPFRQKETIQLINPWVPIGPEFWINTAGTGFLVDDAGGNKASPSPSPRPPSRLHGSPAGTVFNAD
jgi:hypothetical protein